MRIEQRMPVDDVGEIKRVRVDNLLSAIRLDQSLSAPLSGVQGMSKLAEMAERARVLRQRHADRADAVVAKSALLEKRGDAALDGMDRVLAEHEKDISALEGELKQMTNGGPSLGNESESLPQSGSSTGAA